MKRIRTISLLFLCLLLAGCTSKNQAVEETPAHAVKVISVEKKDINSQYLYSGKIKPLNEANVFSTVPGKAKSVYFDIGDTVKEGDVLFQMDTADIQNNINVMQASLATADANIASAKTALDTVNGAAMQTQIENTKAGLANAELAFNNAKTTYDNNKVLFDAGIIAQADMDKIKMAYDNARITYEQAKQTFDIVTNKMPAENMRKAKDAYQIAVSSKASATAQIAAAQKTLQDGTVKSPLRGVITSCNVVAGTLVVQAQPAFTIMNISKVEIETGVSEQVINSLELGQPVDVTLSTLSDKPIIGHISSINPAASQNGTYNVKVQMENTAGLLKVGMLGKVSFTKEAAKDVIVVPRNCVLTKNNESYVYIESKGTAKKIIIQTGIDNGEEIEIVSGLKEGMKLVSTGQTYLSDGDPIKISSSKKGE